MSYKQLCLKFFDKLSQNFIKLNDKDLKIFCNDIITKYPNIIFDAEDFISLQESNLETLFKRDDLRLEESKIWEYTIYKKILDIQLWEDIMQHLISPNQPIKSIILPSRSVLLVQELPPVHLKEPFSTIIFNDHAAEISSWIDRKRITYSSTDYPYEFQLILRGTRDGFAPQTFWRTVVIIKVKGSDEILGGYNPLTWDNASSSIYKETRDSFIFSLKMVIFEIQFLAE
ncbi:hypothetical protein Glove_38g40 [Diversispora epigaea]|uniref:TLDc domain-containing protein n=1 Tax=Diversispora epigaea TaxID=1348612 RepID=A0A397JFU7_9GLOM|nr:hypothetical protein Glove_38g40 [Diversispora epigaea]